LELSIIVPIYKDAQLIESFCKNFSVELANGSLPQQTELVFVDDGGSTSVSFLSIAEKMSKDFKFVRFIKLAKNYGQHTAILTGMKSTNSEFVGFMNVDQEDPIFEIKNVLNKLKETRADLLISLRTNREKKLFRDLSSLFFHKFFNFLTNIKSPINCSTLRIYTLEAKNLLLESWDANPYIPGIESRVGLRCEYLEIQQAPRIEGKSSYTFWRRLKFALTTSISYSAIPLHITIALGFLVSVIGAILGGNLVIRNLYFHNYLPGYTSTVALITFIGGVIILSIGVQGLYLAKIFEGTKKLPLYQVREIKNDRKL
jgi:glycosyltransferase involved in cell wall biosynthesis